MTKVAFKRELLKMFSKNTIELMDGTEYDCSEEVYEAIKKDLEAYEKAQAECWGATGMNWWGHTAVPDAMGEVRWSYGNRMAEKSAPVDNSQADAISEGFGRRMAEKIEEMTIGVDTAVEHQKSPTPTLASAMELWKKVIDGPPPLNESREFVEGVDYIAVERNG